jgi:hypothetical protein
MNLLDCKTSLAFASRRVQPLDAENRMSGGVGGLTGAIRSVRPDHGFFHHASIVVGWAA